jgi:hypothetical protein
MSEFWKRALFCGLVAGALGFGAAGASRAQTTVCEDPDRTVFAGLPGSEGCREIDDPTVCEIAWVEGHNGPASCFFDEAQGLCLGCGPANEDAGLCTNTCLAPPADGTPAPCTIGFWKNRADTPMGQAQHFPDPEFDEVVQIAAGRTTVFADGDALLAALGKQGKRTPEEKAQQQLAALLLNLAGGDFPPDGQKCELFEGNELFGNACVDDATVGEALDDILMDLADGRFEAAKDCADDINNGIGVVDANVSE